jgi:hypothetical protein
MNSERVGVLSGSAASVDQGRQRAVPRRRRCAGRAAAPGAVAALAAALATMIAAAPGQAQPCVGDCTNSAA